MCISEQLHQYRAEVPDQHGIEVVIIVSILPEAFWSLMAWAPQVLWLRSCRLLILMRINEALDHPYFILVPYEMLRPKIPCREPLNMQRVDSFDDLVEYLESLLLVEFVWFAIFAEVEFIWFCHEACYLVVGDLLFNLEKMLRKQILLCLSH